jgi:hypothetical protein
MNEWMNVLMEIWTSRMVEIYEWDSWPSQEKEGEKGDGWDFIKWYLRAPNGYE